MNRQRDYRGRTVIITGGAAGLGRALAQRFADEGARLAILYLDRPNAQACADELRASGCDAVGLACDVSAETSCRAAVEQVREHFGGGIDVLVANAGISARCLLRRIGPEFNVS